VSPPLEVIIDDAAQFEIEHVLPKGWTITDKEGGATSMEAFLKYWVRFEWDGKGFVNRSQPKFPYDKLKLVFLIHFVLGFSLLTDGTFIQRNQNNQFRIVTNISQDLMRTFNYLNAQSQFLSELFDTHFWRGRDVMRNPRFMKFIPFSNEDYSRFITPIKPTETSIPINTITATKTHEYKLMTQTLSFKGWHRPDEIRTDVYNIIEGALRLDSFLNSGSIVEVMKPHFPKGTSDKALLQVFDDMAREMSVISKTIRTSKGRGRKLTIIRKEEVAQPEVHYQGSVVEKMLEV
jgi:hypothetical protein